MNIVGWLLAMVLVVRDASSTNIECRCSYHLKRPFHSSSYDQVEALGTLYTDYCYHCDELDITLPYRFRSMGGLSRMFHVRSEAPRSIKRQELENAENEYSFSHLGFGSNSVFSPRFGFIVERPRLFEE
ncbi:hypothetical protein ANCCAN_10773 [Ancylostoma caninum]|uniref:Uncharacterized protein n=1 Tax=Ancylostoma caninum TaxID=29170 RepID=A0A368GHN8_ANCCA|nr:hypothetical protein ANCCAN_10773 [Ancylostoma caninum]